MRATAVFLSSHDRTANGHPRLDSPPDPRQASPVAECVSQGYRNHVTRSDEHKGRIPAEDGGKHELDQRADDGWDPSGVWMREDELIEMMHVRYAEVERRQEDDAGRG